MDIQITPARLHGAVTPPPSKSQAHRLIIAAALADGTSHISNVAFSQDIEATIRCMEALGAGFLRAGDTLQIRGVFAEGRRPAFRELPRFDCGESGSTLRFLIPIALAVAGGGIFTGRGRLMQRPQTPYFQLFRERGIACEQTDGALTVRGRLTPGEYRLPGDVSSQFFTGLLYALPLLDGASRVISTTPLESAGYLDMTCQALRLAGVAIEERRSEAGAWNDFFISAPAVCRPVQCRVEADWSQAAFYYAAVGIGNDVELRGMPEGSAQGDRVIVPCFRRLCGGGPVTLDVRQCPDLVPALALQAALRSGEMTEIVGAARLRIKESDRLDTVTTQLNRLGACIEQGPDRLAIRGVPSLHGGSADSCNDHRIAMMLAMAATRADGPVLIRGAGSVAKSYPDFWQVYSSLGGKIQEVLL